MDTTLWDTRAALGATAGSQDVIAAELERRAILAHIKLPANVFEAGCGTGQLLIEMARQCPIQYLMGIDSSDAMIGQAKHAQGNEGYQTATRLTFTTWDIRQEIRHALFLPPFDYAVTQRCIINCGEWPAQQRAIRNIMALLVPGGQYVMCECSADGLRGVNELRAMVDLPAISAPAHNRYLVDAEVCALAKELEAEGLARLTAVYHPLSTYALLSRVVNAHLAQQAGEAPDYDSLVNRLALKLPNIGELGQNCIWIWRRL